MSIDIKKLASQVLTEGLAVSTTHPYVFPNPENESTVLLALVSGVVARNSDEYVKGVKLSDSEEESMIGAGVKLIKGEMSPEAYLKKFEKLLKIDLNNIAKEQILMRLSFSYKKNKGVKTK